MNKHVIKLQKGESFLLIPESNRINTFEILVYANGILQDEYINYSTIYVNDELIAINFFEVANYEQKITLVILE